MKPIDDSTRYLVIAIQTPAVPISLPTQDFDRSLDDGSQADLIMEPSLCDIDTGSRDDRRSTDSLDDGRVDR